tara:strand:+ start:146 stop:361 length:216 start_codon:yes stop_codon:yes gene_type:complete
MNKNLDGPFKNAFERDTTGVVKQEFITYKVQDNMFVKEVNTRHFTGNGKDWYDTSSIEPLLYIGDDNATNN